MVILWKILWFAKTPWSMATTKNLLWMSQCVLNWCHCRTETVSWNQIAGIPLDNTYMLLSRRIFQNHILINVTVLFILTSEAIAQILYLWLGCLNLGVGIPPCVIKALITYIYMYSFQPDVAFEENISKSYFYQCHNLYSNCQFWQGHSYRRDIVSMIWLPQLWSGDSPRQHTHVCVQFLSRCFRFQLSRKIYNSPKLEWVSSWKGIISCTSTSYWKTLIYLQLSKT